MTDGRNSAAPVGLTLSQALVPTPAGRTRAELRRAAAGNRRSPATRAAHILTRAAILAVLAIAAGPWMGPALAKPPAVPKIGPSALEVLSAGRRDSGSALLPAPSARTPSVSRSATREAPRAATVATCQDAVRYTGANGRLPTSELCDLWQRPYKDRADAVIAITQLNEQYKAVFGKDMCLSSAYRTLEQQASLKRIRGGLAAPAGQSNHGWGLAVDFCEDVYTGRSGAWLAKVGPVFGWANPAWARSGGQGPREPWHWEFVPGVAALEAANGGTSR